MDVVIDIMGVGVEVGPVFNGELVDLVVEKFTVKLVFNGSWDEGYSVVRGIYWVVGLGGLEFEGWFFEED